MRGRDGVTMAATLEGPGADLAVAIRRQASGTPRRTSRRYRVDAATAARGDHRRVHPGRSEQRRVSSTRTGWRRRASETTRASPPHGANTSRLHDDSAGSCQRKSPTRVVRAATWRAPAHRPDCAASAPPAGAVTHPARCTVRPPELGRKSLPPIRTRGHRPAESRPAIHVCSVPPARPGARSTDRIAVTCAPC